MSDLSDYMREVSEPLRVRLLAHIRKQDAEIKRLIFREYSARVCGECYGRGEKNVHYPEGIQVQPCTYCKGKGVYYDED